MECATHLLRLSKTMTNVELYCMNFSFTSCKRSVNLIQESIGVLCKVCQRDNSQLIKIIHHGQIHLFNLQS